MKEIAAAIYTYENSMPVTRNITSGMISESGHKAWPDPSFLDKKERCRHRNRNH